MREITFLKAIDQLSTRRNISKVTAPNCCLAFLSRYFITGMVIGWVLLLRRYLSFLRYKNHAENILLSHRSYTVPLYLYSKIKEPFQQPERDRNLNVGRHSIKLQ